MEERLFDNAEAFEGALVEGARGGAAILTARGRLARRVLHRYRLENIREGLSGWPSPDIYGLRRWVRTLHQELWEPGRPLSKATALRLWHDTATAISPPGGLAPSPGLYLQLQEAFDMLAEYGMEGGRDEAFGALAEWRSRAAAAFRDRLRSEAVWPWAAVVAGVIDAVRDGRLSVPDRLILAGIARPTPLEASLFAALEEKTSVSVYKAGRAIDGAPPVRVYATPEQECLAVSAQVLDAWNDGCRRLGIAVLDQAYASILAGCLDELAAGEPLREGALRYNLAVGVALTGHPLFRTALLPLRVPGEPDPGPLLASLLSSPYVRPDLAAERKAILDILWKAGRSAGPGKTIRALAARGLPFGNLETMTDSGERPLAEWLDGLAAVWNDMGFPRFSGRDARATDVLAWDHLQAVLADLRRDAGAVRARASDAAAWLAAAANGVQVIEKTPETAGIQVLPAAEAMGLAFDVLWIVGCHGGALPASARDYPFLSPAERSALAETTPEGQWNAAVEDLEQLLAGSSSIRISRAAQAGDEEPYLDSPLVPDEAAGSGGGITVDLWKSPPSAWLRAGWLRGGFEGLASPRNPASLGASEKIGTGLPPSMTVTGGLQVLMQCPFQFFCGVLARLEPVPDRALGIAPRDRGSLVHDILNGVVRAMLEDDRGWPDDDGAVVRLLEETTLRVIDRTAGRDAATPYWAAERARLLGDGRVPGILAEWLEKERQRAREGWRFKGAEVKFDGVSVGAGRTALSGRVDRIDARDGEGMALWDYKTGDPPNPAEFFTDMAHPQLPAYAAALLGGRLENMKPAELPVTGGFIPLKKPSTVSVKGLKDKPRGTEELDFRDFLPRWEEAVAARLEGPSQGIFAADPRPVPGRAGRKDSGACAYCAYDKLCGHFDAPPGAGDEHGEDGE